MHGQNNIKNILLESEPLINFMIQCNAMQYLVYVLMDFVLTGM